MNMLEIGVMLKLTDQMSGGMRIAVGSLDGFGNKLDQLAEKSNRFGRASMANGMIAMGLMRKPIEAFADLDEASTNLRVAMMDNLGKIPPQFAEINKQAVELGNLLPGTTADFTNAATALLENGSAINTVLGGGLKSASYLSVILKMVPRDAAEMVAKFREAYGLTEHELTKMADLTQKAKFAFGLNPDEIKSAAAYSGATLNILHLTGATNAKTMLAIQGYMRQKGVDGSSFGTNFSQMLNQIGQMESKLGRNSKPMHQVNEELAQHRIHLDFFNQQGKFLGVENMIGQLEKLRSLSEQQRLLVTNKLFGMEGGRPASLLAEMGVDGLQKNLALMDKQADITQRINEVTRSAKNTWDAFTGTATNLMAAMGGPAVDALKPYITKLNEVTGGPLQKFVEEHKTLAKVVGIGALALGASAIAIGGVALAIGAVSRAGATLGGLFGKKGATAGVAGKMGGMPIPLPVYVVNKHMSLLSGQMGGEPNLPGVGESTGKAGIGSKMLGGLSNLLKIGAAWEIGQVIGGVINDQLGDDGKDAVGHSLVKLMALMGGNDAKSAIDAEKISHIKHEFAHAIDVKIHGAPANVSLAKSNHPNVSFNAYSGMTMITQ